MMQEKKKKPCVCVCVRYPLPALPVPHRTAIPADHCPGRTDGSAARDGAQKLERGCVQPRFPSFLLFLAEPCTWKHGRSARRGRPTKNSNDVSKKKPPTGEAIINRSLAKLCFSGACSLPWPLFSRWGDLAKDKSYSSLTKNHVPSWSVKKEANQQAAGLCLASSSKTTPTSQFQEHQARGPSYSGDLAQTGVSYWVVRWRGAWVRAFDV
ncbi:hypothetical protein A9K55_001030 [Cordyceps militaris]|uniref:Uncharacterized protein n=1 Tax=Cordyceps militaris TaxID=73501 RepID=A0A2H4SUA5_CORMI|nr:hypothetical protein A9K55_001030 [Cordyceps militaris]